VELLPGVLERSAVALPAPELDVPKRSGLALLEEDERSALDDVPAAPEALDELPPMPDVELASLRGEELLEPAPVFDPVPVLLPEDPAAPGAPPAALDSRTSETIASGANSVAGKVTMATPYPFCTPIDDAAPVPEVEDDPLNPDPEEDEELPEIPVPELLDEELRSVPVALFEFLSVLREGVLRSVDEDAPIPPLDELDPDNPLDVPLVSDRRLLLPVPPLVLPALPDESTGQLLMSAGLTTSPCTMISVS
jgi:hypothetical protein